MCSLTDRMRDHPVYPDGCQQHRHTSKESQQQHIETPVGKRSRNQQVHSDDLGNRLVAINAPNCGSDLVTQICTVSGTSDDRHERPGELSIGNVDFRMFGSIEAKVPHVSAYSYNLQPAFVSVDSEPFANRIFTREHTLGQVLVNDHCARRICVILIVKVTASQKGNTHHPEIVRADYSIVSHGSAARRFVCSSLDFETTVAIAGR